MFDFLAPVWNTIIYDPMLNALLLLYKLIPSYGLAIVLFTLLVGLLTMPLRIKSQLSMRAQQEKTAKLKPRLDELKKKYKDDQQAFQQAQMKLYQEEGMVNPFNAGCLLTLLPLPIFFGLYGVITSVMGSTPEQLLTLSSHIYSFFPEAASLVPVNPNFFGLNLAASPQSQGIIIMIVMVGLVVGVQFVQQKMMTLPSASLDSQQAAMNQQMQFIMPLFFGWIVIGTPAGLSLYWITFGLLGIAQQYFTTGWGTLLPSRAPQPAPKVKKVSATSNVTAAPANGGGNGLEKSGVQITPDRSEKPTAVSAGAAGSKKGKKKRGKKS